MTTQNDLDLVTIKQKIDEAIRTGNISESYRLRRLRDRQIGFQVGDWVVDPDGVPCEIVKYDRSRQDLSGNRYPWKCKSSVCPEGQYIKDNYPFMIATIDDFAFKPENITRKVAVCINKRNEIVIASEDCEHHPENHWDIQAWRELARLNNRPICPESVHKGNYRLEADEK